MSAKEQFASAAADTAALSTLAQARANVFGLVAFGFFDPSAEGVSQLIDGSVLAQLRDCCAAGGESWLAAKQALEPLEGIQDGLSGSDPNDLLHALKVEYARLFIGPRRAAVSPYETYYGHTNKDNAPTLIISPEARAVDAAYREAGVVLANDRREPPDHFATEAEFLYFLCQKEADCWASGDRTAAEEWRRRRSSFIERHLGRWGVGFCRQVESASLHPYYQAMAHFAGAFIQVTKEEAG